MKLTIKTTIAAGVIALTTPAHAAIVNIDFEDVSGFQAKGTSFGGLIFNDDIDIQVLAGSGAAAGPGQSGNVARQGQPPFGGFPRGGSVGGFFDGFTVSAFSVVVGDSGGDLDNFELKGFAANGDLVATSGRLSSASAITVGITGTGIASFFLDISDNVPSNGGSSVFDNIAFDTEVSAVPVPASLPLLGIGLLAFGFASRRRLNA